MHGLLRARGFTQDDAHIFCTTDQIEEEILNLLTFSIKLLKSFGFDSIEADLSTRPEKSIGNNDDWEKATNSLKSALENQNISYVTAHGEGAFYGPKIDYMSKMQLVGDGNYRQYKLILHNLIISIFNSLTVIIKESNQS